MSRTTMKLILSKTSAIFTSSSSPFASSSVVLSSSASSRVVSSSSRRTLSAALLMLFILLYDSHPVASAVKYPLARNYRGASRLQVASFVSSFSSSSSSNVRSHGTSGGPGCPGTCSCKWKSGKKTVDCVAQGFSRVPEDMDKDTQVLDLARNPLVTLVHRAFLSNGLTDLQKIYLSRCELREVQSEAFLSVANLVELDLSHNDLRTVPAEAFRHCHIMRKLLLNSNPIRRLHNASFAELSSLRSLDLSSCDIELIEADAFQGLKSLKNLHLNGNKLRALSGLVVDSLLQVYELNLHGNQWFCDCRLRDLREWMLSHNIPLSFPPTCDEPARLAGRSWAEFDLDEFACAPEMTIPSAQVSYAEGEEARLECGARSMPTSQIDWLWKGRPIANLSLMSFGRQMYLIKEAVKGRSPEKMSTLYIMNALPKDSGTYSCKASNKAGLVSGNVTLSVISLKREEVVTYSGEELAGLVLGLMFVFLVLFLVICFVVLRHKETIVSAVLPGERKEIIVNHHQNLRGGLGGRDEIETVIATTTSAAASGAALSNGPNSSLAMSANHSNAHRAVVVVVGGQEQLPLVVTTNGAGQLTTTTANSTTTTTEDDPPPPAPNQDYLHWTSNSIKGKNNYGSIVCI